MLPLVIAPWQIAMPIFILIILVLALVINSTIRRRKKNKALMNLYNDNKSKEPSDSNSK